MIRARWILAAAALAVAGCDGPADRVEEAIALRHAGKPREAVQVLGAVLADLGDRRLPPDLDEVRLVALRHAADAAYLELGDYQAAIAYYRRLVALAPGGDAALRARAAIGDIYRDRLGDRVAAIAQYAGVAASQSPEAPRYQLEVARQYLALGNLEQARSEARTLASRWPADPLAPEASLLAARALAQAGHARDAIAEYEALARSSAAVAPLAAEEAAALYAEEGRLDRALALYEGSLSTHPNPDAVRAHMEALRRRRVAAGVPRPGDRAAALERRPLPTARTR
ncbi:MAG TPA: tetratricopeptide repeat protein [Anaeromyxobacteraceae bacterium]|nr:tetratricopeptide repeat protein [Anaeromyxobacteraceae bacterium]